MEAFLSKRYSKSLVQHNKISLRINSLMSCFGETSFTTGVYTMGTRFSAAMASMTDNITTGRPTWKLYNVGRMVWQECHSSMHWWERWSILGSCLIVDARLLQATSVWTWSKIGVMVPTTLKRNWLTTMSSQTTVAGQLVPGLVLEKYWISTRCFSPQSSTLTEYTSECGCQSSKKCRRRLSMTHGTW